MYSQLFPVSLICIELCVFTWSQNEKGIIIISVLGTCHSSTRRRRACTHPHTCRHAEHGTALTDVKPKRAHVGQWGKQCCSLLRKEWPSAATQTQGSKTSLPSDMLPMDQRVNLSNKMNSLYLVFSIQHDGVWKVDEALEFCKASFTQSCHMAENLPWSFEKGLPFKQLSPKKHIPLLCLEFASFQPIDWMGK